MPVVCPEPYAAMFARRYHQVALILAVVVASVPTAATPACGQLTAPLAVVNAPADSAATSTKTPKPVDKIYIVGYALLVLMIGLGVLVVCHYRERKARPDLPQEMVAERLRQGAKAQAAQKSG